MQMDLVFSDIWINVARAFDRTEYREAQALSCTYRAASIVSATFFANHRVKAISGFSEFHNFLKDYHGSYSYIREGRKGKHIEVSSRDIMGLQVERTEWKGYAKQVYFYNAMTTFGRVELSICGDSAASCHNEHLVACIEDTPYCVIKTVKRGIRYRYGIIENTNKRLTQVTFEDVAKLPDGVPNDDPEHSFMTEIFPHACRALDRFYSMEYFKPTSGFSRQLEYSFQDYIMSVNANICQLCEKEELSWFVDRIVSRNDGRNVAHMYQAYKTGLLTTMTRLTKCTIKALRIHLQAKDDIKLLRWFDSRIDHVLHECAPRPVKRRRIQ